MRQEEAERRKALEVTLEVHASRCRYTSRESVMIDRRGAATTSFEEYTNKNPTSCAEVQAHADVC
jgi:hypothetical protein